MTGWQIVLVGGFLGFIVLYRVIQRRRQVSTDVIVTNIPPSKPVAEVDIEPVIDHYLARGQFELAANLILTTLSRDSNNTDLKIKLIEVYFISGDAETFVSAVSTFRATLSQSEEHWLKVKTMARVIAPQESFF